MKKPAWKQEPALPQKRICFDNEKGIESGTVSRWDEQIILAFNDIVLQLDVEENKTFFMIGFKDEQESERLFKKDMEKYEKDLEEYKQYEKDLEEYNKWWEDSEKERKANLMFGLGVSSKDSRRLFQKFEKISVGDRKKVFKLIEAFAESVDDENDEND